jgi:hypothetical protein
VTATPKNISNTTWQICNLLVATIFIILNPAITSPLLGPVIWLLLVVENDERMMGTIAAAAILGPGTLAPIVQMMRIMDNCTTAVGTFQEIVRSSYMHINMLVILTIVESDVSCDGGRWWSVATMQRPIIYGEGGFHKKIKLLDIVDSLSVKSKGHCLRVPCSLLNSTTL